MSYKDRTFCASLGCKNKCGRQITETMKKEARILSMMISYGMFCNNEGELISYGENTKTKDDQK